MADVLLIFNPAAARTDPRVVRTVSEVLAAAGMEVEVSGTTRPDDAGTLARQGVEAGVSAVAVYGGDGTTMQAVRGLVGSGVRLGLVPGGTGNLLARNLDLPLDPVQAARALVDGGTRDVDLGRITRGASDRYFAVAAGAGFDARVMGETTREAKRKMKLGAYLLTATRIIARDLEVVPYRVSVDGEEFVGEAATVLVLNCARLFPPFLPLWRNIEPDDGMFDVFALRAQTVLDGLGMVWRLVVSKTDGNGSVLHARGRRVTVETDSVQPVQFDGEVEGETPFTAELLPGELHVVVPRV